MLSLPGAAAAAAAGVVRPEAGSSQPWPGWPTISSWWAMTTRRQVGVAARRAAPPCLASSPLPSFLPGPGPLPPPVGPQEEGRRLSRTRGACPAVGRRAAEGSRAGLTPAKGRSGGGGGEGEGRVNPPFLRRSGPAGKRRGLLCRRAAGSRHLRPGCGEGAASPPPRGLSPPGGFADPAPGGAGPWRGAGRAAAGRGVPPGLAPGVGNS